MLHRDLVGPPAQQRTRPRPRARSTPRAESPGRVILSRMQSIVRTGSSRVGSPRRSISAQRSLEAVPSDDLSVRFSMLGRPHTLRLLIYWSSILAI
jgi:hypothetical protein